MLQELTIKDFAIIDSLNIDFMANMTVLTGETGAGKSIIIDALGLLSGGRGSQEFIRKDAKKMVLQGLFIPAKQSNTLTKLDQLGIGHDDNSVILQREIHRSGKNICRINGMLVNTSTLKSIGETLVDIHGQNEHQELMQQDKHLGMLDEYIKNDIQTLTSKYQDAFEQYQNLHKLQVKRQTNQNEWAQRLDMLHFQKDEIESADLIENEEELLSAEKERLENFQTINQSLDASYQALSGEDENTVDRVGVAMSNMQKIDNLDSEYKELAERLSSAYYMLQDASSDLLRQLDALEWDEQRLNEIENRLEIIVQLKHKYGDSVEKILTYLKTISEELFEMEATEGTADNLDNQVNLAKKEAQKIADKLTKTRKKAALVLQKEVHKQLSELYMDKAIFEVKFETLSQLNNSGQDKVEFYIQTNVGETMGPLAKIASGGELSRMMLALKTIFSKTQGVTSIIFDEVDTGVSGRVAQAIAEKISQIAQNSQVLCITHLPQVAAISEHHYFISKEVIGERTETSIKLLSKEERIQEIARMLAGSEITKLTVKHAEELLNMAQKNN
ncbi:DNA repair protein RecN [Dellaglioa algida]|uniref:DNA repair protein RecN n=1 Tax=Dellaglioa algida DSM 15638 TaxID=1423719 RepID=A0A0R1HJ47_9LACO|nr:DNA repair protein RecN [Dellaglioa algida]KRK46492.1 DNA repair protein RecN [Dellaglioa algida DSM 15638]MDK1732591.1 DNA repair protein RecN [Dellaglioa algida]MDK1734021.1 DNA repair protein RecN [Dellaglioa algida]